MPQTTSRKLFDFRITTTRNFVICEASLQQPLDTSIGAGPAFRYVRQTRLVPLLLDYKTTQNYDCTPEVYIPPSGDPICDTAVNRAGCFPFPRNDSLYNPCAYGTNPQFDQFHRSDQPWGPILSPLNYNSFGFDRHIFFLYGTKINKLRDGSTDALKLCSDSNTFLTTDKVCQACR